MTKYLVAYSWSKRTTSGFGNITVQADSDKLTSDTIAQIKDEICKQNGYGVTIIILNLIKLDKSDDI